MADVDMYVTLAVKALGLKPEQVVGATRQRVKSVLFAWNYGYVSHDEDAAVRLLQTNRDYIVQDVEPETET